MPGATLFLTATQDLNIGGRFSNAQFQYTIQSEDLQELNYWVPRIQAKLRSLPELRDVNSDQQDKGLAADVIVDRDTASRLGITPAQVDAALYASFGQAQVSTMYKAAQPVSRGDGSRSQAAAGHGRAEKYLREVVHGS